MGYYNSFVVRIWLDEEDLSRGRIEHVQTHDSLVFADLTSVAEFIRAHLVPPPSYLPTPGEEQSSTDVSPDQSESLEFGASAP